jgi:ribosomal protein L5
MPPRMKDKYESEVFSALREQYAYANPMQVPKI